MEEMSILGIIVFIVIGIGLLVSKFNEEIRMDEFSEEMKKEINMEEFHIEREEAKNFKINQIQKEVLFTKNYIQITSGKTNGMIVKSKRLITVYHYVFKVVSLTLGVQKIQKSIMLCFDKNVRFTMFDEKNTPIVKKNKRLKEYEFNDDLMNEIIKIYPWVNKMDDVIETKRT